MKSLSRACAVLALASLLPSLAAFGAPVTKTFKVPEKTILIVKTISGNVEIAAGPKTDEVRVEATVEGKNVTPVIEQKDGEILVHESHENQGYFGGSSGSVHFKITLPSQAVVDGKTVSGEVKLLHLNGSVEFKSVSGPIQFVGAPRGDVDLASVSGDVSCQLEHRFATSLSIKNISGNITLQLPQGADARCKLGSISGEIDCGAKLEEKESNKGYGSVSVSGRFGDGSGKIQLKTISGDISIR